MPGCASSHPSDRIREKEADGPIPNANGLWYVLFAAETVVVVAPAEAGDVKHFHLLDQAVDALIFRENGAGKFDRTPTARGVNPGRECA